MNNDKKPGFDKVYRPGVAQPTPTNAPQYPDPKAWPDEVADITYPSVADGTMQLMRFYTPCAKRPPFQHILLESINPVDKLINNFISQLP